MVNIEKEKQIIKETTILVDLFLKTNASDIELSKMSGITSSTVGRRLTNKDYFEKCFNEQADEIYEKVQQKRQENLQNGKKIGGQKSALNNSNKGIHKIDLSLLYKDEEQQYKFLIHAALTFKLHLETLSKLLQQSEDEILKYTEKNFCNLNNSLYYLFNYDLKNQDLASTEFMDYYKEIIEAIQKKDIEKRKQLIYKISDIKAKNILKTREHGDKISDNDLDIILNYQLKYFLPSNYVADTFKISVFHYCRIIQKYLEDKPKLKSDFEYLSDLCQQAKFKGGRYGR